MSVTQKFRINTSAFLLVLALILFTWSIWGTFHHGWWEKSVWSPYARGTLSFAVAILLLLSVLGLRAGIYFSTLLSLPIAIFVSLSGIGVIASVFWYWISATLIGAYLSKGLRDESQTIWCVRNSGAGFVITGTVIGCMAHFPINTPLLYFCLISGVALLSAWRLGVFKTAHVSIHLSSLLERKPRSAQETCMLAIVLMGVTLVALVASLPELGHDALAMHLTVPARMLEAKRWNFDVTQYVWSVMPLGSNWLILPPYFLAGEQAAKLMNASFILATAWLSYRILLPRITRIMALAAPALLLTLPLSISVSGSVFAEPVVSFLFLLCLAELTGTVEKKHGGWIFLAMIAGYACGSKLLSTPVIPILLIASIVLSHKGRFQKVSGSILIASAVVFLLVSVQPYLTAYLKTGNPVFPFYNTIFKSQYFRTDSAFGNGHAFANPWFLRPLSGSMFWESSINSKVYGEGDADGTIGIVFLVLIPLSFVAAVQARRWWVLSGLITAVGYCILVFNSQAYLRYVYQILPWFIVFGAWALARLPQAALTGTWLVALMCVVNLIRIPVAYGPINLVKPEMLFEREAYRRLLELNKPAVVAGDVIQKIDSLREKRIFLLGSDPVYSHYPADLIALSWHSWPFYWAWVSSGYVANLTELLREFEIEVIVHPVGQNEPHEGDIRAMTDEAFIVNGMRVGLVRKQPASYKVERVSGPNLASLSSAWHIGNNEVRDDGIVATVSHPITQVVDVKGNRRGLLEMTVSCPKGDSFRSQINWIDFKGDIKTVDIEVHPCNGNKTQIERVIKIPSGQTNGVIYGSSHNESPVIIEKVSLRTTH